ncbi:UDP-3-O-[3-hydroxymyristoyl] glucosamine N-acyltransferase [Malonomonas rubra DSM 5091]|uniref:UDP-3-O-acylglucosamine N-acyltransferase n=1 Tax=Malonomonas rubra DSM 5091 TaxID=1122189 RepID=A0A1M6C9I4_MALRU|nr:UDP-3-O-(3-hydroxymyristoyl)glucosamine N-acyltransferase [Malonomonas rubra]SHI57461.1 UDP-3-O-[3-hydroxymyristoyl] glucosamine N-acyltransferase [Malonomonas rubra DSM 5091]
MSATLQQLAELIGAELQGDPTLEIRRVFPIDQAQAGDITFVANPKYLSKLKDCQASAVIVAPGLEAPDMNLLVTENPYLAFAKILTFLQGESTAPKGIMQGAHVAETAELGDGVSVYPGAVIGENVKVGAGTVLHPGVVVYADVVIGENCLLHAGAIVREGCRLGNRVILQPSAVIGADGFGFAPDGSSYYKIPQVGIVVLEDDVEIGACSCVDRAAMGVTRIGRGTKFDNLVQIGHNADIGEDCLLVSHCGVAGSSKVGNHCTFGGQTAVAGHVTVGDNVTLGGRTGVTGNVDSNQLLSGLPPVPHKEWLKMTMSLPKVPEMRKELQKLKKRLAELEAQVKED